MTTIDDIDKARAALRRADAALDIAKRDHFRQPWNDLYKHHLDTARDVRKRAKRALDQTERDYAAQHQTRMF